LIYHYPSKQRGDKNSHKLKSFQSGVNNIVAKLTTDEVSGTYRHYGIPENITILNNT